MAKRFNKDNLNDDIINSIIEKWISKDPMNVCRFQTYITIWYFSTYLESEWTTWCYIAWFDKDKCKSDLKLDKDIYPEIIFACWYKDEKNPWSAETDFVRNFEDFYKWSL